MDGARRTLWLAGYVVVVLAPMAFVLVAPPDDDVTVGIAFAAAIGFAALVVLALQLVLPARLKAFTEPFGVETLLRFHKEMGTIAAVLVVLHVVVLMADDPGRLSLLVLPTAPWRAIAGVTALLALLALLASASVRQRFRLDYARWRGVHLVLGVLVVAGSVAHVLGVGRYLALDSLRALALLAVVAPAAGVFALRVGRPFAAAGRPYRLRELRAERGDAATLELQADGHDGLRFTPGQFAWLKLADAPYALSEHPFSLTGSAERPGRPQLTVKALGDFTAAAQRLEPGTRVLLDGPHGRVAPALPDAGWIALAGGIGITPVMALLRTLADREDPRPVLLVYANRDWEQVTFREELDLLQERLELQLVHILSRPPEGWTGETGRLDAETLQRLLPPDASERNILVCGGPGFTETAEGALRLADIPRAHVRVERFA